MPTSPSACIFLAAAPPAGRVQPREAAPDDSLPRRASASTWPGRPAANDPAIACQPHIDRGEKKAADENARLARVARALTSNAAVETSRTPRRSCCPSERRRGLRLRPPQLGL